MCYAGISAGLSIVGNYMSQSAAATSAQKTMDAQSKAAITGMNYKFQNFEQERIDAFDATLSQLDKLNHSAMSLNSSVKAAVNEGMAGRSANLIERQVEGDTARTSFSIKDNYTRKSNEVDLNKESALKGTKATIQNINDSAPTMPSAFTNFLTSAQTIVQAVSARETESQNRTNALGGKGNTTTNTTDLTPNADYDFSGNLTDNHSQLYTDILKIKL